jgi:hypothetical protein
MTSLSDFKVTITYPYESRRGFEVIISAINSRDAELLAVRQYGGRARATSRVSKKKMKTFEQFNEDIRQLTEAPTEAEAAKMAPGLSPEKRRAALERNARNQARRSTPDTPTDRMRRAPQKALPPGAVGGAVQKAKQSPGFAGIQKRPSGSLAKTSAGALAKPNNSSSAIVRTKQSGPSREAVGKSVADDRARRRPSAGYMTNPDGPSKTPRQRPTRQKPGSSTPNPQTTQGQATDTSAEQEKKKKKKKKKQPLGFRDGLLGKDRRLPFKYKLGRAIRQAPNLLKKAPDEVGVTTGKKEKGGEMNSTR